MSDFACGWKLCVDQGPDWVFARLEVTSADHHPEPPLAEHLWNLAQVHAPPKLVFELGGNVLLFSFLVGQMILVHKRIVMHEGQFRICGFSAANAEVLYMLRLSDRFLNYRTREAAVMGHSD